VTGYTINTPGTNYTTVPTVTISGGSHPTLVTATATGNLTGDSVSSYTVSGGAGYLTAPTVASVTAPPTATQATATALLTNGAVSSYRIDTPGTNYTTAPSVSIAAPPTPVRATATSSLNGRSVGAFAITNAGLGYPTAPSVTIAAPPAATTATATALMNNNTVIGYTITSPGSGYAAAPTVTIAAPPANVGAIATARVANGAVTGFTVTSGGSGYQKTPAVSITVPPAQTGTATASPFNLRTLLHVSDGGVATLLSQVYLGQLTASGMVGLCTKESLLKTSDLANAKRFTSAHLPLDQAIISGSGAVAVGGILTRNVSVPFDDATNPFVHQYHPDHNNQDAAGKKLAAGVESPDITRSCTFTFTTAPPAGSSVTTGWGSSVIGGTYVETLAGLHKDSLVLSGTFELRRASQIGVLSQ